MSDDFLDRIRTAAAQERGDKAVKDLEAEKQEQLQTAHFNEFKRLVDEVVIPAFEKIEAVLAAEGYKAEIVKDLRDEGSGWMNHNSVALKFSKASVNPIGPEIRFRRTPGKEAVSFTARMDTGREFKEVNLAPFELSKVTDAYVMDVVTMFIAKSINQKPS